MSRTISYAVPVFKRVLISVAAVSICLNQDYAGSHAQGLFKLSESDEIAIGQQAAAEVEKKEKVLDNPALTSYIDRIGQSLVQKSGRPNIKYQFKVIDSPDVNAFALPGGFIYVNRGLIEASTTESELAGCLAHEVNHVVARHSAAQIQRAQMAQLGVGVLGSVLGGGTKGQLGQMATQMVAQGTFMKFSRDAEREADRLGAKTMYDAGYDPAGMISLFEKLEQLQKTHPNSVEKFFASHPSPAERIDNVSALIADYPQHSGMKKDTPEFQQAKTLLARGSRSGSGATSGQALAESKDAARAATPSTSTEAPAKSGAATLSAASAGTTAMTYPGSDRDREIAQAFAPIFVQGLADPQRFDYITNFDFDGDWRGDNNWENAANTKYPLLGYVYYSVTETKTHFFVHYAVFHPRDTKGGNERGAALSQLIREGAQAGGKYDPTGLSDEAVLAHENDLEGCMIVAQKGNSVDAAKVVYVETVAHNRFLRYAAENSATPGVQQITLRRGRPRLFVEPKGHGIQAFTGTGEQLAKSDKGTLTYRFGGQAEDPEKRSEDSVGYELVPIYPTLWRKAAGDKNDTFGLAHDYGNVSIQVASGDKSAARQAKVGMMGSAFAGKVGAANMSRPPWGWFDNQEKDRPAGEWFLDPAAVIKRHFNPQGEFSLVYVQNPALDVFR
ncbi:MAG TPA: M48 family metallopeptidase [Blastocatellia bacterium]|nr:M48 family metallopeptidase [Blastocatellia bacterium]